ncbi:9744_t:CDS:1 [Paraglomus brasilianum]|uniref:9744_t:CDS:1 n=1 Tax=Paraglomus brasilianum TaxID=144538 RepID=A0A9N9D8H0_9GLOM|nr:9744_t:CDS:1 [Paraglomus brasilianum]
MKRLPIEIKTKIASHLETPYLLGCCSREWYSVVNLPHTKYRWLINKYGRIHALFHAVRIGEPFLNLDVAELVLKNSRISRYLVQRLKLVYGKHCLWGSNISNNVYERILNYKAEYASSNCDDMQSICQVLEGLGNEDDIRTIIEVHNLTPFPLSPTFRTYIFENSASSSDDLHSNGGYATVSELKIMAKAIITYPNLLNAWRRIGYHEVTTDLENPVVQLTLLNLYSTSVPSAQVVAEKLCYLQSIGFPLTDTLIGNALFLFRRRLIDVGESLIEGFSIARKMSRTDVREMCLIELLDPTRNLEYVDVLDYIIKSVNDPEKQILSAFEKYRIVKDENDPMLFQSHTSLKYSLVVYRYMLRFGAAKSVVRYLMKEIIIVHTQITNTEELGDADIILDEYYAANVPFEHSLLPLFKKCPRAKPIIYLFKGYLAKLFEFEVREYPYLTFEIPDVDVLTSPAQTKELQRLWLEDIQKCIKFEELVNDEFKKQIIEFFTIYNLTHSSFDHQIEFQD